MCFRHVPASLRFPRSLTGTSVWGSCVGYLWGVELSLRFPIYTSNTLGLFLIESKRLRSAIISLFIIPSKEDAKDRTPGYGEGASAKEMVSDELMFILDRFFFLKMKWTRRTEAQHSLVSLVGSSRTHPLPGAIVSFYFTLWNVLSCC